MRITGSRLLYFSHQRLRVGNRDGSGRVQKIIFLAGRVDSGPWRDGSGRWTTF